MRAALAAVALAGAAQAADPEGLFAVKGAGVQDCGRFLAAWDGGTADLPLYAGWVEGYVTALNQRLEGVFDLAPWQDATTLLGLTAGLCRELDASTRFIDAVDRLARRLTPHGLAAASPATTAESGGRGVVVYRAVLAAAQARLAELALREGPATGDWDAATATALAAFQRARGLEPSGLPDQRTLFELLLAGR